MSGVVKIKIGLFSWLQHKFTLRKVRFKKKLLPLIVEDVTYLRENGLDLPPLLFRAIFVFTAVPLSLFWGRKEVDPKSLNSPRPLKQCRTLN